MPIFHLLFLWTIPPSLSTTTPKPLVTQLQFRVTVRDFMAGGCSPSIQVLEDAWNGVSLPASDLYTTLPYCPILNDVLSGTYMGHPDFEADGTNAYTAGTSSDITLNPLAILATSKYGGTLPTGVTALSAVIEPDLDFYEDGLPKPRYCNYTLRNPSSVTTNPRCGWPSDGSLPTTTGKSWFDMWYRDTPTYNKRVGYLLELNLVAGTNNTYDTSQFPLEQPDSTKAGYGQGFHPLDEVPYCNATTNNTLDCSNGGRIFPRAHLSGSFDERPWAGNHTFAFTTEVHETFSYRGTEVLTFSGDDDLWIFINEKLAVDLGGLHSRSSVTIDLSNNGTRAYLNLTVGQTYAFDAYHAERHSTGSNFLLTTTLVPGCTVADSTKLTYTWNAAKLAQDWKLVGGPTWGIVTPQNEILVTALNSYNTAGYAILRQQQNVGAGFIISFSFRMTAGMGEGFVFTLKRDSIDNMNGGTGGNLGFKNSNGSLAIAFDFCASRPITPCNAEVRLHYPLNGGSNAPNPATATSSTRIHRARLYHPNVWNDGHTHTVMIRYHGARVLPWLDVFVDSDLFLQDRHYNQDFVLGGKSAWIGFTSSTGTTRAADLIISDLEVKTVAIDDIKSYTVGWDGEKINSTANGKAVVTGFEIANKDYCDGEIQFGGFSVNARAILIRMPGGQYASNGNSTVIIPPNYNITGVTSDLNNGHYQFSFKTLVPGNYSANVWYGSSCFDSVSGQPLNPVPSTCFFAHQDYAVEFAPLPPTSAPTPEPPVAPVVQDQGITTGFGIGIGIISGVGGCLILVGIRLRNRWRREKAFIEAGRIAAAEKGVDYIGDNELDGLQSKLQRTLEDIQKERARHWSMADQSGLIKELNRQRGELQEQVRMIKIRQAGGDPYAPVEEPMTMMKRVRMSMQARPTSRVPSRSFAAGFTSRIASMSIGWGGASSSAPPLSSLNEIPVDSMQSDNPAFAYGGANRGSGNVVAIRELEQMKPPTAVKPPFVPPRSGAPPFVPPRGAPTSYGGMGVGQRMSRALGFGGKYKPGAPPPEPDI